MNGTILLSMHPSHRSPKIPAQLVSRAFLLLSFLAIVLLGSLPATAKDGETKPHPDSDTDAKPKGSIYDFSLVDQDGKVVPLSNYKGKVLLIVNLASQSIYSSQIAALNDLEKTYAPQGLQVIGIPSADFGNEELKDPASMRKYYTETAQANFPVFASAKLTGISAIPLFQFLCNPKQSVPGGDIKWNYTKFLIDKNGTPLSRYEVDVDPADIDFHVAVESALSGKFKKPDGEENKRPAENDGDADDE